jgi:Uma2 family endonuclease
MIAGTEKEPAMSTAARRPPPRITADEFLAWSGDGTGQAFQLVDGEPRALSPGSATHAILQATLAYVETGSPCRVATEPAVAPRLRANLNLRVPDLGVTCTPVEPGQLALADPVLLIEILSPNNEADTWENVWAYASIPSVREILVVHSTRVAAELLQRRADGVWPEEPAPIGPADTLLLESIGLACPLVDLYAYTHRGTGVI